MKISSKNKINQMKWVSGFMAILMVIMIGAAAPVFSQKVKKGKKVLIYTKNGEGYVHENIPYSVKAIRKILEDHG